MRILLYRRRLSLTSGAGQLIRMQQEGLRAEGQEAIAACQRGACRFLLRTRLPVRCVSATSINALAGSQQHFVVDHQMAVPQADLIFVHNLMTEACQFLERDDWQQVAQREAHFFELLRPQVLVVANSELVRRAIVRHFPIDPGRVVVHYPGFRSESFRPMLPISAPDEPDAVAADRHRLPNDKLKRDATRASIGVAMEVPLIGFVTSGEFDKRGLDIFLDAAEQISKAQPEARFLVVGAKRLPTEASRHPLVTNGRLVHRPKGDDPERWFAALDLFLYPARFEEFGMVVSEAQASGLPVLTSRRVGAAECLPDVYRPWILDEPDAAAFAALATALLDDEHERHRLSAAGVESVRQFGRARYVQATVNLIIDRFARKQLGEI